MNSEHTHGPHCAAHGTQQKQDWLLIISSMILILSTAAYMWFPWYLETIPALMLFAQSIAALLARMWWGVLLGIISVGIIGTIPRDIITYTLGKGGTLNGILRATAAGVLLDLCSHGILLVGMKLYERGASVGQTMAFLIASPWNSLSLTLILWSLVGFKWMITILLLSFLIAVVSGIIFDQLVKKGILPANPNHTELTPDFSFRKKLTEHIRAIRFTPFTLMRVAIQGVKDSKMILRWIFFGIVLAAFIRTVINPELFAQLFGPTVGGLGATLLFATILEVCSEGSMPVATDMLLRARAAGNTFAFLMSGVSTDYTEIIALKETTKSWKIALFLPLVTLPQVILIALILNAIPV